MSAQAAETLTFRDKFVAWWEGTEPVPHSAVPEDSESAKDSKIARGNESDDARASEVDSKSPGVTETEKGKMAETMAALRERLVAWWNGQELPHKDAKQDDEDLPSLRSRSAKVAVPAAHAAIPAPDTKKEVWTPERVKIAERIWGAGYVFPGGNEQTLKLIKPLGLNPKVTFADLNAGTGGAARAVCEAFGIWVTAMEPNDVLAAHGMDESNMAGLGKKASVIAYDPESAELRPNSFDSVFVQELFFTIVNKRHLITEISKSLKKGGQLLFTDYLLAKTGNIEEATQNWMSHEPIRPEMWSIKQMHEYVEKQGLEIRIEDDMTQEMCGLILRGWRRALPNFRPGHFEPELGHALLAEAELWARRLTVLLSGDVRVYRIHAFKK